MMLGRVDARPRMIFRLPRLAFRRLIECPKLFGTTSSVQGLGSKRRFDYAHQRGLPCWTRAH